MDAYIYQADIYCENCACEIMDNIRATSPERVPEEPDDEYTYDSDDWPKGPFSDGGGESDCPQHCGSCHEFLENPLTSDGIEYVRTSGNAEWCEFYDITPEGEEHDPFEGPTNYHYAINAGLKLLRELDSDAYSQLVAPGCGFSAIPNYANDEGESCDWWKSEEAEAVHQNILDALTEYGNRNA